MVKALIFANGEQDDGAMVERAFDHAGDALVIAADGGAHIAQAYGYTVQTLIGDMDSLTADEVAALEQGGTTILRFPPEKDETDLELALRYAVEQRIDWLRIIGGTGGRFDQMMANVYLLALPELRGIDAGLAAGKQAIYLLHPGQHEVQGVAGDTISLIPIAGNASGVSTERLKYPLRRETLHFGPARGISNVMLADTATVALDDGLLLVVHTVGRA